ncbi:MAG: polyhydroxyalkanoate synthesis repressor PhaR [Deltaproteobacteria bacterium]|nr:polyhydroxyalkanoate synthesis repressor PhaR [Deltaproteobacteria bacterium]MCB9788170.1 polyhydroxyalkanoate synthesis repressor PhaR [Deltaproteobacteria bacterium]
MPPILEAIEPVIVRKYGNRRLYRTDESRYVTLEELAELVRDDVPFEVHDAKSGDDLTGVVLAQVILEQEKAGEGGSLPVALLRQLIRMRDERLTDFIVNHLQRLTDIYMEAAEATSDTLDMAVHGAVHSGETAVIVQLASVRDQLSHILDQLELDEEPG